MKKIIFSANDMGMSPGINEGIIDGYKNGVITQACVLATSKYLDDALEKSKANPGLGISAHLDLSNGKPLLDSSLPLTDEDGFFVPSSGLDHTKDFTTAQYNAVELELKAQIKKLKDMGFVLSGVSTHKRFSKNPNLFRIMIRVCNSFNLPMRDEDHVYKNFADSLKKGTVLTDTSLYGDEVTMDEFKRVTKAMFARDNIIDLPSHPGHCDAILMKESTYNKQREQDLAFLKSKEIKKYLDDNNIELYSYAKMIAKKKK